METAHSVAKRAFLTESQLSEAATDNQSSDDAFYNLVMWAEEMGHRIKHQGKVIWKGLGNRSGLHSEEEVVLRKMWDKSGARFQKKLKTLLVPGATFEVYEYKPINRDRGKWKSINQVTLMSPSEERLWKAKGRQDKKGWTKRRKVRRRQRRGLAKSTPVPKSLDEFRTQLAAAIKPVDAELAAHVANRDIEDTIVTPVIQTWWELESELKDAAKDPDFPPTEGTWWSEFDWMLEDMFYQLVDAWQNPMNHSPGDAPKKQDSKVLVQKIAKNVGMGF